MVDPGSRCSGGGGHRTAGKQHAGRMGQDSPQDRGWEWGGQGSNRTEPPEGKERVGPDQQQLWAPSSPGLLSS